MTKQLFLIEYENAHWCGGGLNVVVWAENEDAARYVAGDHMDECQRELFEDHYESEIDDEDEREEAQGNPTSVISVEEFNEAHDQWQFYMDPTQESFYPVVGEPD